MELGIPTTAGELARIYLGGADESVSEFPEVPSRVRDQPYADLQQEWVVAGVKALMGIGWGLLEVANATRQHTETIKNLAAEGSL